MHLHGKFDKLIGGGYNERRSFNFLKRYQLPVINPFPTGLNCKFVVFLIISEPPNIIFRALAVSSLQNSINEFEDILPAMI